MEVLCNFLFLEETSNDNITTFYPIVIKFEGKLTSIRAQCTPRINYAASLPIKHLSISSKHNKNFVIVGAGPTIYGFIDELSRIRDNTDNTICSINRAHEFLVKRNIIPDIHILYERDISSIGQSLGGQPHKDVTYYICSTCDENIFRQLEGYKRVLWHSKISNDYEGGYRRLISSLFPDESLVEVGHTSFTKSFGIGLVLGYSKFELYGIDCSIPFTGPTYIDEYKGDDPEDKFCLWAANNLGELRKYYVNITLMTQAADFVKYCKEHKGLDVKIHGEGLLGFVYDQ